MPILVVCGINHQTAPVALREKLAFAPESVPILLASLLEKTQVEEATILSTCNRTEIYCVNAQPKEIVDWLQSQQKVSAQELERSIYIYQDAEVVRHLLRVTTGLDSMVLGETQIASQVKKAFSLAEATGAIGSQLRRLAHYVFSASKEIRTQTEIGAHPVSLASAAVNLAKHIFADMSQTTALLIGAGETVCLAAKYLQAAGVKRFIVANRTLTRAMKLANELPQGQAIELTDMSQYLAQADIVIAATSSPVPVVGKGTVESALKQRKHRPIFMADLAVPRDIEPEIATLSDVYLSTLDDLQTIVAQNLGQRSTSAEQAEQLIDSQVEHYMRSLKVLEVVPVISAYRQKAEAIRDIELNKALQQLQSGVPAEQVLAQLSRSLTNKLLHEPSVELRKAAYDDQNILAVTQRLFGE